VGFGILFTAAALVLLLSWVQYASSGTAAKRAAHARLAQIAALMLVGLGVAFFLIFAVGELAGGETSGVQHLPPAGILGALLWLGWKRPRAAGIVVLLLFAVPLTIASIVGITTGDARTGELWIALLIPLVPIVTAGLFVWAGTGGRAKRRMP
jgi:cytochrome bd-type quinol oxidase subunit 2